MTARRGRITFPEYAARWRASREFTWEIETRRRIPGNITYHLNPAFPGPIRAITTTDVLEWIACRITGTPATPRSSMKLYCDLFRTIMNSAEIDGLLRANPCRAIKTAAAFRGLSGAPRWIPTETQVLDLFDVVPRRYHAALWLGAGQGCRIGEVLAVEDSPACFDLDRGELHVRQQLQYDIREHGGFFLKEPKGGSSGTIALDCATRHVLAEHLSDYGIQGSTRSRGCRVDAWR
jgi:integrase